MSPIDVYNLATLPAAATGEGELPRGRPARPRRELARERVARRAGRPPQDGRQRVGLPHDARLGRAHERRGRRQVRRQEQERRGRVPGKEGGPGGRVDRNAGLPGETMISKS